VSCLILANMCWRGHFYEFFGDHEWFLVCSHRKPFVIMGAVCALVPVGQAMRMMFAAGRWR